MSYTLTETALKTAIAFAPATVANVAVGYDILGFAMNGTGDTIRATKSEFPGVQIKKITGHGSDILPMVAEKNTAGIVVIEFLKRIKSEQGISLEIHKGIPLSSGMGGSAASSVGALVAVNELFGNPLSTTEILEISLLGEELASGNAHADNLAPCLLGGLVLNRSTHPLDIISLPVWSTIHVVLVHPNLTLETRLSRSILKKELPLKDYVQQSANLATFIVALYEKNLELMKKSLKDSLIEKHRAALLPGFYAVKDAAISGGALGCSIAGAGPSVFAWCESESIAESVKKLMIQAFTDEGIASETWVSQITLQGAHIIEKIS